MSRTYPVILVLVLIGALVLPTPASANMANPHQPGDPVGEPSGGLESVAIERETLVLDLRPLADDQPAVVDATYNVRNDGSARTLRLVFVATGLVGNDNGVWLDGQPISTTPAMTSVVPSSWEPPKTTPGIDGGALGYDIRANGTLTFALSLTAGRHRIRVHYGAHASAYSGDAPARYWQLGYVLAPARSWESFGGLDVDVRLPPGWRAASSPSLTRVGDVLTGSFRTIPADTLGLTVQAPIVATPRPIDLTPVAWLGGLIVAAAAGLLIGRWLGQRRRTLLWAVPPACVVGILWAIAVLVSTAWDPAAAAVPASQVAWTYDYGRGGAALAAAFLAFLAALLVLPVAAFAGRRHAGQPRRTVAGR